MPPYTAEKQTRCAAGPGEGHHCQRQRRLATRGGDRPDAALERCHPLLERGDGRVGDSRIDVAGTFQVEEGGGVIGVVEDEPGAEIDRNKLAPVRASGLTPAWTARVSKPGLSG